jgi:hypothetical protein
MWAIFRLELQLLALFIFSVCVHSAELGAKTACSENWDHCRQRLIAATLGQATLPSRVPDYIFPHSRSHAQPPLLNNETAFVWTITDPLFPSLAPVLNATVYWTLNSSCHAPPNYNAGNISKGISCCYVFVCYLF